MFGYWYNPNLSNTIAGLQAGLAVANGIMDGVDAKKSGATTQEAISRGLTNAAYGVGNAYLGNLIDRTTMSYTGSAITSAIPALTNNNPSAATPALFGTALMTSLFQPMFYGYYGMMPFSSASFVNVPMGGMCYYC